MLLSVTKSTHHHIIKSTCMQYRQMPSLPEVVKNLLIINVLMFLATMVFPQMTEYLAMFPVMSEGFQPYQIVTHMFMHGGLTHLLFNMFALWMFGRDVEYAMGAKKFLIFYFISGLGAAFLHQFAGYIELQYALAQVGEAQITEVYNNGLEVMLGGRAYRDGDTQYLNAVLNTPAVGASGAIYGILAAFGLLYPNRMIILLIPPIPMKAKYFVLIMGGLALYMGLTGTQGGVAHFAHLGGAIFGYLLILYWRRTGETF